MAVGSLRENARDFGVRIVVERAILMALWWKKARKREISFMRLAFVVAVAVAGRGLLFHLPAFRPNLVYNPTSGSDATTACKALRCWRSFERS